MKFGTLQVFPRQGVLKEHGLDLPSAIVGRGEGAAILIDDFSVSRRHARLTVDSARLEVEDLGSVGGTFVNGERLEPGVRHLVDADAVLRFGEIEARYLPVGAPEASAVLTEELHEEATFAATGLSIALASPQQPIEPGRQVAATLVVVNRGRLVDNVRIEVLDLPADWYSIDTPNFPILPGGRADVKVTLHPPRRYDATAGRFEFTVRAVSQEYDDHPETMGEFDVLPFESAALTLEAVRSKKNFRVLAENHGNALARYELSGRDEEQAFRYAFETPVVELQPGEKRIVSLAVRRPRQLFGYPSQPQFEVVGQNTAGAEITARGQLSVNPPLQKFKMPVAMAMVAALLVIVALAVFIIADDDGTKVANAEDPYAGVHLCEDPDEKAKEDKRIADAADDKPNTNAIVVGPSSGGAPVFGQVDRNGAPFFAQSDARWATQEYARSTELPNGKDWCGTTIEQCGCAMTSVSVMLALYDVLEMPGGEPLSPKALNDWFNGAARKTDRGWVSRGYIYGDVIWSAANELSGEIAKTKPETRTVRFVRTGTGSEDEIRADLQAGRPVIVEVPGHWIAAVGLDGDEILINDPFYRDRKTLSAYAGKVRSSVHYEPSSDLSSVVITAPADVKFKVTDKQGRVVSSGLGTIEQPTDQVNQIPGASVAKRSAWRDPTCIEKAPPANAGTNQIVLPGSRDDYIVEIIDTGGQPGSVAIHTYGRDGTSSIATIEGGDGTQAELQFDPNADKPVINIMNGGASGTPTPNGGGAGGGEDETPTAPPTALPPPTATQTPFVEQRTAMTLPAEAGQTRVEVATNSGFELGDPIRFAPGLPNQEDNLIVGFGSFILATPLQFAHGPGEPILRLQRPPGQGPGLPPGITPPPSTGPLVPPTSVVLGCSTIYQASPKLATFICDLTVEGTWTTTRWTVNGQIVDDFSGSPSLIMTFPGDSPANVAVTVCNVTLCRSTTRSEKVEFPPNLTGTTQTGGTGSGGATTPPPPPPAGTVTVTCVTQFPVTADGQMAQFECTANFQGSSSNISWSAPGGTPANQGGNSKTFTTTVKNEPGTPVSLKVTATVCNFGTCFSSKAQEVGISRTMTILESRPSSGVNVGHTLTLMARVEGLPQRGSKDLPVVPQGGTVQFYREGNLEVGAPAQLITFGRVSITIPVTVPIPIPAGTVGDPDLPPEGEIHTYFASYTGGVNAFGSDSEPRNIFWLPPVPDGCDSVNNDIEISDHVTDGTCEFHTPKDLGAGTMMMNFAINGQLGADRNTIVVDAGQPFSISGVVARTEYCPGCIRQVYVGIGGYDPPAGTMDPMPVAQYFGPWCVFNRFGVPLKNDLDHDAGFAFGPVTLFAPNEPGVYYLRATPSLNYFCAGVGVGGPDTSIGRVVVRKEITSQVQLLNGSGGLPSVWDDTGFPKAQVDELISGQQIVLRANVPPGTNGRIRFVTEPADALRAINPFDPTGPNIAPTATICPESGEIDGPGTAPDINCTPWEARLLTVPIDPKSGPITVHAVYEETDFLELRDPADLLNTLRYFVRSAADPPSNEATLRILAPTEVTTTASPSTVAMGSDFTLSAEVESVDDTLNLSGFGGLTAIPPARVQFWAGLNKIGEEVTVDATGFARLTWRVGVATPVCTYITGHAGPGAPGSCGTFQPFDSHDGGARTNQYHDVYAQYITDGDSLLQNACAPSGSTSGHTLPNCHEADVDIEPGASTATITTVVTGSSGQSCDGLGTAGPYTAGQCISVTVTVTGATGFPPTGGNVIVSASGGPETSDNGTIGNQAVSETSPGSGIYTARVSFVTGNSGQRMDTPGSYTLTAEFEGTSALDESTSAGYAMTLGKEAAFVAITAPASGTSIAAGSATNAAVTVTASSTSHIHPPNATVALYDGTTLLGSIPSNPYTLTSGDSGTHNFSLSSLAPGTYKLRAVYSGSNFYLGNESAPGDCSVGCIDLTVTKAAATVTLDNLTRTTDVAPTGSDSVADHFTIRANVNPGGSPGAAGGTVTLTATINGTTTTLGTHALIGTDAGRHTFSLDTSSGVLLTTDQISFNASYDGNTALNAGSTASPTNLTLAKANTSVAITAPSSVTIGNSVSVSVAVTSVGGLTPVCPAATANCVELRIGGATGTLITSIAVGGTFNSLTTNGASGTCLDSTTTTPPCQIWVGYTVGTALFNTSSDSHNVSINQAAPTVSIVATDVTIGGSTSVTVSITGLPAGVSADCTGCLRIEADSVGGGRALITSAADVPAGLTFSLPTGALGEATSCLTIGGQCKLYAMYGGNAEVSTGSDDDTFTIAKLVSTTTVVADDDSIELGQSLTVTATITVGGNPAPNCTTCVRFHMTTAAGTQIGSSRDLTGGTATATLNVSAGNGSFTNVGTYTVFAVYDATSTIAGSNGSDSFTITLASTTVSVDATPSGSGELNATATVTSACSCGNFSGSVEFYLDGSTTPFHTGQANNGVVTISNFDASVGAHTVTARYMGGGNYGTSPISAGDPVTVPP